MQPTKPWFLYIAKCNDDSFYVGISNNVKVRIQKHNSGIGAKSLHHKLPLTLLYIEKYPNKSEARIREIQLKGWSRKKKQWLINEANDSHKFFKISFQSKVIKKGYNNL